MASPKRNVVLISLDDAVAFWNYKTIFGEELKTPNLDRLCARATSFRSAYCQSPVCGPSRASFLTAKTPHELQIFHNHDKLFKHVGPRKVWTFAMRRAGFFCSSGGKVHHGYKPLKRYAHGKLYSDERKGFRIDRMLREEIPQKKFGGHGDGIATIDPKDDDYYHDAQASASFVDFISNYDKEAPFYREVGFYGPHTPFITPERYKTMYDPKKLKRPAAWDTPEKPNPFIEAQGGENLDNTNLTRWRNSVRNYFSAYSHVDHHLGRVLDALEASPHADNTMIVLLSDHGFHLGEKNRFRKLTLWEQVANVPLIIYDPANPKPQEIFDPVALLDVGPTVLDYLGLAMPEPSLGRSLRPQIEGASDPGRVVATFHYDSVAIRKGPYRLIRYEDGSTQFYDVTQDWWQTTDLGETHPDFAETYAALEAISAQSGLTLPPRGTA
ncbi:MAG: sulfatase-like hydrolase/transferase [Sulfitobacter sp.]